MSDSYLITRVVMLGNHDEATPSFIQALKPARLPSIDYIFEKNAVTPPPPNPSRRRPMQKKIEKQ